MKAKEIEVGKCYTAKVSNNLVPVRVVGISVKERLYLSALIPRKPARTIYHCKNLATGREITVKSAQRFRRACVEGLDLAK